MEIVNPNKINNFSTKFPEAKKQLLAWASVIGTGDWKNPVQLKEIYGNASILKRGCTIFNISGNKFRIVTHINYAFKTVTILWFGTHEEYDELDVQETCDDS
jgi:mRNA interferase HigB